MSNFGELVLVLGDLHIPERENAIPEQFQRMLVPNKMQHVICTGNLGSREQYEMLRHLSSNVHVVSGDCEDLEQRHHDTKNNDHNNNNSSGGGHSNNNNNEENSVVIDDYPSSMIVFPETRILQVGEFRIGVIHGHQIIPWGDQLALAMLRRKLNVDILISGHTHKNQVIEHEGYYYINPGSITGAYSPITDTIIPSFILLAVQGSKIICYVYELINSEVEVSKTELIKQGGGVSDDNNDDNLF